MRELQNDDEPVRLSGSSTTTTEVGIRVHGFPVLGDFGALAESDSRGRRSTAW